MQNVQSCPYNEKSEFVVRDTDHYVLVGNL